MKTESPSRVLVVDDQETARFFASETLRQAGFVVEEAGSGPEALALVERLRPDLILLDVLMPGMDGFEVCQTIRGRAGVAGVPILMMTGLENEEAIVRSYDAGATDFIGKPFKRVVLTQRVRHILRARRSEERIHQLAYFDTLTSLANRESFRERLLDSVARAERSGHMLAIIFLDLDDFKRINDTLGHSKGDALLEIVARRLLGCVREGEETARGAETFVARLGGDEFIVLLPELETREQASNVAERILETLSRPCNLAGYEVYVTPSIGIGIYPGDASDAESLLQNADVAMYVAKRAGKNAYRYYDATMNEEALHRLALENQLRRALERDEFALQFQPQLDLATGKLSGLEALLRWNNAEFGTVSPVDFIPLAEATGLIVPIGQWVLRSACAQAREWRQRGFGVPRMGVNISAMQFVQRDFVEVIEKTLHETGLEPGALELEITESLLASDAPRAVSTLEALKELGVQLAVDDFGTGYSSLSYLKRFPIDRLKIDRSFVRDVISEPDDAAIATAVVAMGRSMGLGVIAEGVETEAQLEFLKARGCAEIQGYLLSRPLPADEVADALWSQTWSRDPVTSPDAPGRTALFVDDDNLIIAAVEAHFDGLDFQLLTCTSVQRAFDLLASNKVDVVVSDYRMPDMTGTEFLGRVRRLYPAAVRVMMSGESNMDSLIAAINAGALYKFLQKPIDWDVLAEVLDEAFSLSETRRRRRRAGIGVSEP